ncbi:hypothetical protein FB595_1532 [Sphingobium sp. AEW010]|nr:MULTISPECIES: hypothetical protein [unclassified Sphingobium]PSO09553.1 hypothetical protein C7E20_22030 [Sphingobium sp. AEW4]TWC96214.1 hypothetical protein FB595_1532 [Sphingobium sp. AEW010]TWD15149.1 hypothetical protein FB596_1542 [Sphingobium sp. AEW013]TWD19181.1 hypothetical protein FB594_1542 [Sphingobium sp. AEW001]
MQLPANDLVGQLVALFPFHFGRLQTVALDTKMAKKLTLLHKLLTYDAATVKNDAGYRRGFNPLALVSFIIHECE